MHITGLFLVYHPAPNVVLNYDERVNVFIGPNGSGKSMILRVLEYVYFPQKDHPFSGMPFADSTYDDRTFRDAEELYPHLFPFPQKNHPPSGMPFPHSSYEHIDNLDIAWVIASNDWPRNNPPPTARANAYREPIWNSVPLLYVPATRVNLPLRDGLDERGDDYEINLSEPSFARSYGWKDADPAVFNGQHVKHVADNMRQVASSRLEDRDRLDRVLDVGYSCAKSICTEMIHDYGRHTYVDSAGTGHPGMGIGTFGTFGEDVSLHIRDLSSGTQGTFLWIWALCLKMARHYDWQDGWESRPAILLIDEIENHLHPTWQRRVIPALLKHFPGLQIFATTHSPFVIAGLKAGQVHLLSRDDFDGSVLPSTNEQDIIGWTADEILRTFMGVAEPTDELTATNAQRLRVLRRKDVFEGLDESERAELEELRTKAGADILARGGILNAQRERFADMVKDFLKERLADAQRDEA